MSGQAVVVRHCHAIGHNSYTSLPAYKYIPILSTTTKFESQIDSTTPTRKGLREQQSTSEQWSFLYDYPTASKRTIFMADKFKMMFDRGLVLAGGETRKKPGIAHVTSSESFATLAIA